MTGYPVSRATAPDGRFVYTLYQQNDNYPFVHALDTVHRTAVCIGLPWKWWTATGAGDRHRRGLTLSGHTLRSPAQEPFTMNTKTYRVNG